MRKKVIRSEVVDGFLTGRLVSPLGAILVIEEREFGDPVGMTYRRGAVYHRLNILPGKWAPYTTLEDQLAVEFSDPDVQKKLVRTWIRKWDREMAWE